MDYFEYVDDFGEGVLAKVTEMKGESGKTYAVKRDKESEDNEYYASDEHKFYQKVYEYLAKNGDMFPRDIRLMVPVAVERSEIDGRMTLIFPVAKRGGLWKMSMTKT